MKEKYLHLGAEYPISELIEIGEAEDEELHARLKKFYIASCKKLVKEKVKLYQKQLRVNPKSIEIDTAEYTKRWASCNSDRILTFHYRLAMAPPAIIDYVIVHELCHLLHMNHDRSFWRCVGSVLPDYKKRQEFLENYGGYLSI